MSDNVMSNSQFLNKSIISSAKFFIGVADNKTTLKFFEFLMIFFNAQNAQNLSPYLLSYTFNFIVSASNFTGPNWLWSLSLEEQFYLAWPAIVLLSPSRKIPFIMSFVFFIEAPPKST